MYDILEKNDMMTGLQLVVKVPEGEVDKKALYTLLAEPPDFLLPFNYRLVDGLCELTYQVGTCNKMVYMSGVRNSADYLGMWQGLLKPLLDCGDWFMKTFSFALGYNHIYCDKDNKTLKYVYIPTLTDCSDYAGFRTMVMEVIRQNRVTDIALENQVLLWALQDSTPQAFFDIVVFGNGSQENKPPALSVSYSEEGVQGSQYPSYVASATESSVSRPSDSSDAGTIIISAPQKPKVGFFNKLKNLGKNKTSNDASTEQEKKQASPSQEIPPVLDALDESIPSVVDVDILRSPRLRYTGVGLHPRIIEITLPEDKGMFIIGRHNADVGIKQGDFEFDKNTKGISHRHVVVESDSDGYTLMDLNSDAGTFVNDQKLTPNTPIRLENGYLVRFGNLGANYVWEMDDTN